MGMDSGTLPPCAQAFAKVHERGFVNGPLPMAHGPDGTHDRKEASLSLWFTAKRCLMVLFWLVHMDVQAMLEEQPMRSITLVVGYAPGGLSDRLARLAAKYLEQEIDKPVVVKNVSGAAGVLAAHEVLHAKPESPSLLLADSALILSHVIQAPQSVDLSLFSPIGTIGSTAFAVAVSDKSKFRTLTDLLAHQSAPSSRLTVGTPGANTVHDLTVRLMLDRAQVKADMIHYRGGVSMLSDLINDRLSFGLLSLVTAKDFEKSKHIRVLAVTAERRSRLFPNVPTVSESYSKLHSASVAYLLASPQMSENHKEMLIQKWRRIIQKTEFLNELSSLEMGSPLLDAAGASVKIDEEKIFWSNVVKIQPN